MKYIFHTTLMTPREADGSVYDVHAVEVFARDAETAWKVAEPLVPEGSSMWCWNEDPDGACTMCGGPFHPATGHWASEKRHWCGPCTRSMVQMLKEMQPRRWGKVRFYDLATVPTGTRDLCPKCRGDVGAMMHVRCILR